MNSKFSDKITKILADTKQKITTFPAQFKIKTKNPVISKIGERITDFRIDKLSRLSKKTIVGIGAATLAAIVICGAFIFTDNGEPGNLQIAGVLTEEEQEETATVYYAINIDSVPVAALATEEDAQAVLDGVIAHYSTEGSEIISAAYNENIEIVMKEAVSPDLMSAEEASAMLITGTKEPRIYTVEGGDCLWDIAVKNGMTVEELISSNPDADIEHLKIGSTLNLYELKPYIHVTVTERVAATEKIDYKVTFEETNTLYKGEIKVKTAGVYGKREVTKELVKENGVIVSSAEIDAKVISEPSAQVNLKGTKSLATLVGSGSFGSPMNHLEVSSAYGSRGGGRHTGVDLRNPKGTPIYVVDDGVVTFSAYSGSYGNIVKVSHGNGIETWYAHCDTFLVSTGTVVKKGQQIATVGITGRATGYHLHFEVRKNGVPQNPMNYL